MTELYLKNSATGKRYRVVSVDKASKKITLEGEYSTFTEDYDPARFKELGYVLEKEDD